MIKNLTNLLFLISSLLNLSSAINLINQDDQIIKQLNLQTPKSPINFDLLSLNRNSDLELNNKDFVNFFNRNYDLSSLNKNLDLSSLISKNFDIYSLLNNRNQIDLSTLNNYKYLDSPVPIITPSSNLLSFKNNTISPKSLQQPFVNTADLWRSIQKLRSLFSARNTRSNNAANNECQCPQASEKQQPTFIPMPIPVVERIHHIHHDRQPVINRDSLELNKYLKNLNDIKYSPELRSLYNLNEFKPLDLKNQFNLNYDLNKLPLHTNEQLIKKDILDQSRFNMGLYNNQLANGRSINNFKTFNPLINHDIYLQNLQNFQNKGQTLMQPLYLDSNKDRQLMPDLNRDESSLTLDDGVGTNAHKDEFNLKKILNEISQLLLNDMENSSQRDSSKMKILKLLSNLETYLLSPKNKWSSMKLDDKQQANKQDNRLNKLDDRLDKLQIDKFNAARFSDDKLNFDKSDFNQQIDNKINFDKLNDTNWFISNNDYLMNNLLNSDNTLINDSIDNKFNKSSFNNFKKSSSNNFKKSSSKKKKKNQITNDDNWSLDDEYFTDYLPSETELKKTSIDNDFQPIVNYSANSIKIVNKKLSNNNTIDDKNLIKNNTIKLNKINN